LKNKIEKRVYPVTEFRIKKTDSGETILEGYSAVFDKSSFDLGWGDWELREFIAQEAFTKALKNSDCRALFNHDPNFVLGRESAKTLSLKQDEKGLRSIIILLETSFANDLAISVERGDIKEQYFCFIVAKDKWTEDRENKITTEASHSGMGDITASGKTKSQNLANASPIDIFSCPFTI